MAKEKTDTKTKGGAPKGNPFWKLRSKHGRDKLFASPELMEEAANEYFQWCDDNPWIKKDWVGKNAKQVDRPTARPYTLSGLCLFLECDSSYFRAFKAQARIDKEDFITVITRIEEIIYTQKFEGAAVGAFNANIIARDLGLVDKQELNQRGMVKLVIGGKTIPKNGRTGD